ncbi:MAG: hypothetical protein ACRYG6_01565 [Janthinobacterium lividum]
MTPDPHGQAALMLCEGLALLLIERGTITREEAVDVIEGLVELKHEIAMTTESPVVSVASILLLQTIGRSMSAAARPATALT